MCDICSKWARRVVQRSSDTHTMAQSSLLDPEEEINRTSQIKQTGILAGNGTIMIQDVLPGVALWLVCRPRLIALSERSERNRRKLAKLSLLAQMHQSHRRLTVKHGCTQRYLRLRKGPSRPPAVTASSVSSRIGDFGYVGTMRRSKYYIQ